MIAGCTGLSRDDLQFFDQNGFVGPFDLYGPETARHMLAEIRAKNWDRTHALFDNCVNYDRHFDISELSRHIGHPGIVGRVRSLLGPDVLCWRTEWFPKFPGATGTEWHQVEKYEYATGTPMLAWAERRDNVPVDLTVWTAFTDATRENGCMKFLPGSHKTKYFDESKKPAHGREGVYVSATAETGFFGYNFADFKVDPHWEPDESKAITMEMRPGQCIIFSAKCVHASHPNTTKRSTRFAIASRYVAAYVRVYPDQKRFRAHGGDFDLTNYGCVLVSGEDRYGHNQLREANNLGKRFPYVD